MITVHNDSSWSTQRTEISQNIWLKSLHQPFSISLCMAHTAIQAILTNKAGVFFQVHQSLDCLCSKTSIFFITALTYIREVCPINSMWCWKVQFRIAYKECIWIQLTCRRHIHHSPSSELVGNQYTSHTSDAFWVLAVYPSWLPSYLIGSGVQLLV